ncbi:MAG: hypothetical protein WC340_15145 [Kiritimatiellia bacterium]
MAYDRIMKRHARNRGRNRQILSLPQQDWRGVNAVDDIYSMAAHQIPPAQNVDLGSPIGSITKVAGYESLFPSLGAGGIGGLRCWKHSDGDKLVFQHAKQLYLISGESGAISMSSKEDWEAGTGVNIDTVTSPGDVTLAVSGEDFSVTATTTADFNGTHENTVAEENSVKLGINSTGGGAARYYIQNATAGYNPSAKGGWDYTGSQVLKRLSRTKGGSISSAGGNSTDFSAGYDALIIKAVTDPLVTAKTLAGTLRWCLGVHTSYNMVYHVHAWVTQGDSSTVRGTLLNNYIGSTEFPTTAAGLLVSAQALTSVSAQAGDRIVIEIGFCAGGAGEYYSRIWYGGTGGDLTNGGDVTTLAGWFEFSQDPGDQYYAEGTYTHGEIDISGIGITTGVTITYNKTTPAGTAAAVQTNTYNGSAWEGWTARAGGDTVIPSDTDVSKYKVRWRVLLSTTDNMVTPSLDDVTLAGDSGYAAFASLISPVLDLGNTPTTALLSWAQTVPEGTSVRWFARGGGSGTVFGDWREIFASGGAIPLLRYSEIKFEMTGTATETPTVSSLLVGYSFDFTKPHRLDISPLGRTDNLLTGNRVSMEEYEDRLYCADGLRPFVLYADDSTIAAGTAQGLTLNPLFSDYTGTIDDDTGDTFTDWTESTGGTGRVEAVSGGISGTSLKITMTDASDYGDIRGVRQYRTLAEMGLVVGDIISIAASYKMSAQIGSTVVVYIQYQDSGGGQVGDAVYVVSDDTAEVTGYARKVTEGLVIPEGTNRIRFTAGIRSTGAYSAQNNQLWVDYFTCSKQNAITLAAGASAVDGFYNNAFITITGGTGSGQVRFISGYDGTSKIVTVSEPWDTVPDVTSTYSIGTAVKVRNAGVDPPATACNAAEGGGTGLTGAYKYKITFVNRDGYESNPSAASNAVTVTSKSVSLTDIPTGDSTITERKIYRTKSNSAVFYYVATLEDNTTTTYSDTTADTGLSSLMLDNNNIPPNCSLVYSFLTYMFYVFMDELWFSKATEPESVPAIVGDVQNIICPGLILDIKHNPMALIPMGQDFVAPITTSTGFIFDSDPAVDTTTMRVIANSGSLSAWASDICITPDLRSILAFPSRTGIMALLPGLQEESIESFPLSRNIQTYIDRSVNRESMAGIYHNGRYRVSFQHLGETGPEWVTFSCDFRQEGREWHGPWTYGASCYVEIDGILYAGDPQDGKIYRMDTGNSFDGANIRMIADTRMLSPQGENFTYRYNNFMVMVSAESDTTELIIKPKVDNREASIVPGKLVDTFAGDKRAGHDNIRSRKFRIPLARGSTISYRIEDDSTNPLSIQKIITEAEVLPLKR